MNNKDKVRRFFTLLTEQKVKEAFGAFVADEFKHHNQHTRAGRQALLEGMTEAHKQFPSMVITVKHMVEEGDLVIAHSLVKMDSNHLGFICAHIFRFMNGKISEMWDLATPVIEESLNSDGAF